MTDRFVIFGLIICAILVLIPILMIARLLWLIVSGHREYRQSEARRVTVAVPGLGEFSSTDDRHWTGDVRGVQIMLDHSRGPPSEVQAMQVLRLLDRLPQLTDRARQYIVEHENTASLTGDPAKFAVYGIEAESEEAFVLELVHPDDLDGVYRIEFRDGMPVSSGRDD